MGLAFDKADGSLWLDFAIKPCANPVPEAERAAKLANLGFGRAFTDHMAIVRYDQANGWNAACVDARGNFPLDPATAVLHYAQEIFEGLKAFRHEDGSVWTFRPEKNAERMQAIIKEMGAKHILHASHKAKRLKKARPV